MLFHTNIYIYIIYSYIYIVNEYDARYVELNRNSVYMLASAVCMYSSHICTSIYIYAKMYVYISEAFYWVCSFMLVFFTAHICVRWGSIAVLRRHKRIVLLIHVYMYTYIDSNRISHMCASAFTDNMRAFIVNSGISQPTKWNIFSWVNTFP